MSTQNLWRAFHRYKYLLVVLFVCSQYLFNFNLVYELANAFWPDGLVAKTLAAQMGSQVVTAYNQSPTVRNLKAGDPELANRRSQSINLAVSYLGMRCADMANVSVTRDNAKPDPWAKKLDYFTAAGGLSNNCADFVTAILYNSGRLSPTTGYADYNVAGLNSRLLKTSGWRRIPKSEAKAGDVWMRDPGMGHVMLVANDTATRFIGCNNNLVWNVQYVTLVSDLEKAVYWTDRP